MAWVRIPGLSFNYYHKSTLRAIGMLLGKVVKIDYLTEMRGQGRYSRIAVLIDLLQPLVPWIRVDGRTYGVEYEALPLICFEVQGEGSVSSSGTGGTLEPPASQFDEELAPQSMPQILDASVLSPLMKERKDAAEPIHSNKMGNVQTRLNATVQSKSKALQKPTSKSAHTIQMYRPKEKKEAPPIQILSRQIETKAKFDGPVIGNTNAGSSEMCEDGPLVVLNQPSVLEESQNAISTSHTGFLAIEQKTSLDQNKHMVVVLQRERTTLEDISTSISTNTIRKELWQTLSTIASTVHVA
ncbi:hypothetical protein K1719_024090 [Acacia pycnantha]|nr:hypothetical protein K1719_024090 [Acacia pycnantha]